MAHLNIEETVHIRDASEADLKPILGFMRENLLYHVQLDADYYLHPDPIKDSIQEEIIKLLRSKDGKILLAENLSSEPMAMLTGAIVKATYFDNRIERYGMIYELFVDEKFRKLGLGVKLLNAAQVFFKERGCDYVQLQTSSFNTKAQDFYKRLGFEDRQRILVKAL